MADVFLGSVYANLELRNVEGFQRSLGSAADSGTQFKNTMLGVFAGNLLTQGFEAVTRAVVGFGAQAVTSAADLQSSMGLLQAVTGATAGQMKQLSDQAIALGNDITLPAVSAADASDAMIELGKAGLSVNDIMGASKGVLQAAAAGNIAVADSAKIVSGALLTFGLKGTDATKVADLLAAAANASSLELGDVGLALTQAGAQASIAGLSLSETIGIIGQMANKGISAQQAGTSLSYMLKSLLSPTDKAGEVMEKLGLKMFDAEGKFVGARGAIEQLGEKTKGLTQEQRAQALSTIFGAEALKAANVVITDGTAGFDKMQQSIGKVGAANDLAKSRQVGFNGAMAALQNTLETTAIGIGQVFLPALTGMATFVTANLQPILIGLGTGLVALAGYFIVTSVAAAGFGAVLAVIFSPVTLIVAAAIAVGAALAVLQKKFDIFGKAADFLRPIITGIASAMKLLFGGDFTGSKSFFGLQEDSPVVGALLKIHEVAVALGQFLAGQFKSIWDSLQRIFDGVVKSLQPLVTAFIDFYQKHAAAFQTAFKVIGVVVAALTFGPLVIAIGIIVGAITVLAKVLEFVADHFVIIRNIILGVMAVAFAPFIIAIGAIIAVIAAVVVVVRNWGNIMQAVGNVIGAVMGFLGGVFTGIGDAIMSVVNAIWSVVTTVFNAIVTVITTVFNAIMAVWNTVLKPVFDGIIFVITALGTIVFTIFSGIVQVIFTVVSTIVQIIGVVLYGIVLFIYNQILLPIWNFFVTVWNAIYGVISAAVTAIWGVISSVFTAVWETISGIFNAIWGVATTVWDAIWGTITGVVNAIWNTVSSVFTSMWNTVSGIFNSILNTASSIFNSIKNTISNIVSGIFNTVSSTFNNVKNAMVNGMQAGLNAVTGFVGRFLDAGRDIVNGIVKGVTNGKDAVVNKIKDICSGALDAVKSFFGIKSPSKVMAKMFGYVMQGAKLGITQNAGSLMDTFNQATQLLPSAMDVPVTMSAGGFSSSVASLLGAGGSNTQNTNSNVTVGDVTINTRQEDSRFMQLITRSSELADAGIVGAGV